MRISSGWPWLAAVVCMAMAACDAGQLSLGTTAAAQTPGADQSNQTDTAIQAALSATGNSYPAPALFVKRWNLLAQAAPIAQISKFTARMSENEPRAITDLGVFNFARAERTYLQIGSTGLSVDYTVTSTDLSRTIQSFRRLGQPIYKPLLAS